MDPLTSWETSVISAVTGIAIGTGLAMAYLVNVWTRRKACSGSSQQKLFAYGLRVASVVAAYAIILFSARTLHVHTEKTLMDAAFFFLGIIGIVFATRQNVRKKDL